MTSQPPDDSLPDVASDMMWRGDVRTAALSTRRQMLVQAAARGQTARLAFLQAHDPDVCRDVPTMETALHAASCAGQRDSVKWLLERGANAAHGHNRCLLGAVNANSGDVVDLLLRHGADIRQAEKTVAPSSLLMHAVSKRKRVAAKALLLHGCSPFDSMPDGQSAAAQMRTMGMITLLEMMARLWPKNLPAVPADFAAATPLEDLQRPWPSAGGMTGYQLCAHHGQIDMLLHRLTANGRVLSKTDLITATPRYPQTVLFILGQRGELSKAFAPALWGYNAAAMRDILPYVPAAFRGQIDAASFAAAERHQRLRQRAGDGTRLRLPKPPKK